MEQKKKHLISILTKDFYMRTENIFYILQEGIQFRTGIFICGHAITVKDISSSFNHSNNQIFLSL
jgi:hypothetical protein